jgi:hypothetical protein
MFKKLRSYLSYKAPERGAYGISAQYYLSVLIPTTMLPSPSSVCNPKGEAGAWPGFFVPLTQSSDKSELLKPLKRGVYVASSSDKKTVLKVMVMPKEEAGFQPEAYLNHPSSANLSSDLRASIAATWFLVQCSFETHDPQPAAALHFFHGFVSSLASHSGGVIADAISQRYFEGGIFAPDFPSEGPVSAPSLVKVIESRPGYVHTLGMQKISQPEFEIQGFQDSEKAMVVLLSLAQHVLESGPMTFGAQVGDFTLREGGLDRGRWEGIPVLELVCNTTGGTDAALAAIIG